MKVKELIPIILAGVAACFVIFFALEKRPTPDELQAKHTAQKEKRDAFSEATFRSVAFRGVVSSIEESVVRTPYREMRYHLHLQGIEAVSPATATQDTTEAYDFRNAEDLIFTLGHKQGGEVEEGDTLIKRLGRTDFFLHTAAGARDTLPLSFRLFAAPDNLRPYLDTIRARRAAEKK